MNYFLVRTQRKQSTKISRYNYIERTKKHSSYIKGPGDHTIPRSFLSILHFNTTISLTHLGSTNSLFRRKAYIRDTVLRRRENPTMIFGNKTFHRHIIIVPTTEFTFCVERGPHRKYKYPTCSLGLIPGKYIIPMI